MKHVCLFLFVSAALQADSTVERLQSAAASFQEIMQVPERSIPQDLLQKAECAIIIPGMKKGAFIVGAKYGRGFLSCRKGEVGWSAPAGVRVEGGSLGFQIGGTETDVVMLVLNSRGADKLMKSKFTLGADAAVAAGPVGRTSSAETDAMMHAEILSWSRSRGVFAGISLKGATLRPDTDANRELYGSELTNKDIVRGDVKVPEGGGTLVDMLNKFSSRK